MIKDLLPDPIRKPVPHHPSYPHMMLWPVDLVQGVEKTPEYTAACEKASKRKVAAAKATETKSKKTQDEIALAQEKIKVKKLPTEAVMISAARARQDFYRRKNEMLCDEYPDAQSADDNTKQRWAVNYVRHNLTCYDETLYDIRGKVGVDRAYCSYKCAVLDKIAEAYPELAEECERQKDLV